jgi:(heptosyl)LPS beta-1,4-glucosyltransferase
VNPSNTKLSIVAMARSEARHLRKCFKSLEPLRASMDAETLVILDSRGDAATREAAEEVADRVVESPFVNFSAQRNRGLREAAGEWVFFVDPDERGSEALAAEIAAELHHTGCAAYRIPRRNIFFGHEVRHTGWWPDFQVRLLRRDSCSYDESREVHEVPTVQGATGTLRQPLVHFNYDSWRQFLAKQWSYARYDARALHAAGRRARPYNMLGQPLRELKRRLLDYQGYKDGLLGLALSIAMSLYVAETYRQLWLMQKRGSGV